MCYVYVCMPGGCSLLELCAQCSGVSHRIANVLSLDWIAGGRAVAKDKVSGRIPTTCTELINNLIVANAVFSGTVVVFKIGNWSCAYCWRSCLPPSCIISILERDSKFLSPRKKLGIGFRVTQNLGTAHMLDQCFTLQCDNRSRPESALLIDQGCLLLWDQIRPSLFANFAVFERSIRLFSCI